MSEFKKMAEWFLRKEKCVAIRNEEDPVIWRAGGGPGVPVVWGFGYWTSYAKQIKKQRRI